MTMTFGFFVGETIYNNMRYRPPFKINSYRSTPYLNDVYNEQPRRKRRGIKQKILNAPRGGELNPRPPLSKFICRLVLEIWNFVRL